MLYKLPAINGIILHGVGTVDVTVCITLMTWVIRVSWLEPCPAYCG